MNSSVITLSFIFSTILSLYLITGGASAKEDKGDIIIIGQGGGGGGGGGGHGGGHASYSKFRSKFLI